MDFLTGENIDIDSGSIIFDNKKIETFNPKKEEIYQLLLFQKIDWDTVLFLN